MIPIHKIISSQSISKVEFILGENVEVPVTATLTFPIIENSEENTKYVLIQDKNMWWNAVGGHLEEGETILDALEREVMEECGAVVEDIKPIGYFLFTRISGESKYPKISQIPLTVSRVKKLETKGWILRETIGRGIFTEDEVIYLLTTSREDNNQMLEIFKQYVRKD